MDGYWMRALDDAEHAEDRARVLRARFGAKAEARCRAELQSIGPADPRRRKVEDVQRALRWVQ